MSHRLLIALPALLVPLFFATLWTLRHQPGTLRGDEGTYVAMAESLARDGDLWFDARDRERLEADERPGRKAVILQRTGRGVAYSKPILYPLLAAPFVRLFGEAGLFVLNAVSLAAALALLAAYLRRLAPGSAVGPTVAAFAGLGLLPVYLAWCTADLLQAALTLAGFALCLWELPRASGAAEGGGGGRPPARLLAGAALLAVVVSLRLTNAAVAIVPLAVLWLEGRRRRAWQAAAAMAVVVGLGLGATVALAGAPSPYAAVRATFTPQTGYPAAGNPAGLLEGRGSPFDYDRASYDRTKKLVEAPLASVYGALYFLAGRHTGVLVYFPLALFLVAAALREPGRIGRAVLAAVGALAVFYLVFLPFNYFGGATCVGNRYFLVSYAALPFALRRPLGRRALVAAWGLGMVVALSALSSVAANRDRDRSTQSHAHAGLFRRLPFESVAAAVDGVRDVFWNKEMGRFLDPYAGVSEWSFRLDSRDPATRVQVANRRRRDVLRFLVLSPAPRLDFVYSDWGQRGSVRLEAPVGRRGLVEIEPSRPLRVHPLWFRNVWDHGLPYSVRAFQLAVRSPDDEPVTAEVRYLGVEPWPDDVFERQVLELTLPARATAGARSVIPVRVRNTSRGGWAHAGVLPVRLSYRLTPEGGGSAIEGARVALPGPVAPGVELAGSVTVAWPERPGRYRLTVDLVIEGVAWFEGRTGEPLARAVVEVVAAGAAAPSGP